MVKEDKSKDRDIEVDKLIEDKCKRIENSFNKGEGVLLDICYWWIIFSLMPVIDYEYQLSLFFVGIIGAILLSILSTRVKEGYIYAYKFCKGIVKIILFIIKLIVKIIEKLFKCYNNLNEQDKSIVKRIAFIILGIIGGKLFENILQNNNKSNNITVVDPHEVSGYIKKDGTKVNGYWRDGDGNPLTRLTKEQGGGYLRRK